MGAAASTLGSQAAARVLVSADRSNEDKEGVQRTPGQRRSQRDYRRWSEPAGGDEEELKHEEVKT